MHYFFELFYALESTIKVTILLIFLSLAFIIFGYFEAKIAKEEFDPSAKEIKPNFIIVILVLFLNEIYIQGIFFVCALITNFLWAYLFAHTPLIEKSSLNENALLTALLMISLLEMVILRTVSLIYRNIKLNYFYLTVIISTPITLIILYSINFIAIPT